MTWNRQTTLWCDGENCNEWYQITGTKGDVVKEARDNGWSCPSANKHYCPEHA